MARQHRLAAWGLRRWTRGVLPLEAVGSAVATTETPLDWLLAWETVAEREARS